MARSKLDYLISEIDLYLGLPYWSNKLYKGQIIKNGPYGGKGNFKQINQYTNRLFKSKNPTDIYRFQKKHKIGIDCSGLAYHLLNYWYKINTGLSIKTKIIGTKGKLGPRRVDVQSLSNPINSIKINQLNQIKTADLIVIDQKKHVLFVIEKTKDFIKYVHSSQKTKKSGVHLGTIKIIDPKKTLNYQQFSDITKTSIPYQNLFDPKSGDGIYRLISLQSIPHT